MIYLGSRFQNEQVQAAATTSGVARQFVQYSILPDSSTALATYVWSDGDRIDRVALEVYGSASRWWKIMDANPEIPDPGKIAVGTVLKVPPRG